MSTKQLDRLKSQLLTSGLQQSDNATWQVINQLIDILRASNLAITELEESGSGAGITALTTDVVATGPGVAVATIQPNAVTTSKIINDAVTTAKILDNNVTYEKIQQVSATERLLGNGDISAPADVQEIALGDNLEIRSGVLEIVPTGGTGVGLSHKVLSDTHSDSIPADAVLGDLIYAGAGTPFAGQYVHGYLNSAVIEDFEGIRAGYMLGFNGNELGSGNVGWGAPPPLTYIDNPLVESVLVPENYDGFLQTAIIEDFEGIRPGYMGQTPGNFPYATGNNGAYLASMIALVAAPDLANPSTGALWQRLPIGTIGQVLQPNPDGIPEWSDDLTVTGSINAASVSASGSVSGSALVGLASVAAPLFNGEALAVWVDVTFNAGDFTANGGTTPTWTLTSPDQTLFRYCYIGAETMMIQVYLSNTSVASAAGNVTELRILIPDGRSAVGVTAQLCGAQENGVAVFDIYCGTDPGVDATKLFIRTFPIGSGRAFDQTANASYFAFTAIIKVS